MATLRKTPAGTWKAVIRKKGWPTAAKTFRTKRDAEDWARRTEDEMVQGVYIRRGPSSDLLLRDALDRYLAEVTPGKAPGTQASERGTAKTLSSELGDYALVAITPGLIAEYRDRRLASRSPHTGRLISPSTVRLELALLSHVFSTAIREWQLGLPGNPVAQVKKPSAGEGRNRRLSWPELKRLFRACDDHSNPMLGWIVRLALYTAMRQGEILSLERGQVDLSRRIIRLTQTKNGSARTVPLSRRAVRVLRQALNNPARPPETDLIFPGEPGADGQRRQYQVKKVWAAAVTRAGLTADLRFHDLRHEATSRLVEMGLSDQEVAAVTGHKSMAMLKRYTHLRAEDLVARLDSRRSP